MPKAAELKENDLTWLTMTDSRFPFTIDDIKYPTIAHYFRAMKYVKAEKQPIKVPSLKPVERKSIHTTLQDNTFLNKGIDFLNTRFIPAVNSGLDTLNETWEAAHKDEESSEHELVQKFKEHIASMLPINGLNGSASKTAHNYGLTLDPTWENDSTQEQLTYDAIKAKLQQHEILKETLKELLSKKTILYVAINLFISGFDNLFMYILS